MRSLRIITKLLLRDYHLEQFNSKLAYNLLPYLHLTLIFINSTIDSMVKTAATIVRIVGCFKIDLGINLLSFELHITMLFQLINLYYFSNVYILISVGLNHYLIM